LRAAGAERFAVAGGPLAGAPTEFRTREPLVPAARVRYLAEIAARGREARERNELRVAAARRAHGLFVSLQALGDPQLPAPLARAANGAGSADALTTVRAAYNTALDEIGAESVTALAAWPARELGVTAPEYSYQVRGREVRGANYTESLSHSQV